MTYSSYSWDHFLGDKEHNLHWCHHNDYWWYPNDPSTNPRSKISHIWPKGGLHVHCHYRQNALDMEQLLPTYTTKPNNLPPTPASRVCHTLAHTKIRNYTSKIRSQKNPTRQPKSHSAPKNHQPSKRLMQNHSIMLFISLNMPRVIHTLQLNP
jgi:hypothetical protein